MISQLFRTATGNGSQHARSYIAGLLSTCQRKNMERVAERLAGVEQQDLQHFLTDSPWESLALWRWTGQSVGTTLGGGNEQMLILDESGFSKKGTKSAGVSRQYNGRMGKLDNCQVGVFSALGHGQRAGLVGARLYLPQEWVEDKDRCEAAGIPETERVFRTKNQLAWELIEQAQESGLPFSWVGVDAGYGRDQGLLFGIAGMGKYFMAGVDKDQRVWEKEPAGLARPVGMEQSGAKTVEKLWEEGRRKARKMRLRTTENGHLEVRFWAKRVWIWPKESERAMAVWLVVTKQSDGKVKYGLSNGPEEMKWKELAKRQGQRYFIERVFEEGKSQLGMGQYQVRQWRGWEHHMALVGAAMAFTMSEREFHAKTSPLTSVRDVVEMVAWHFERPRTAEELSAQIAERHRRRRAAQESKLRRNKRANLRV